MADCVPVAYDSAPAVFKLKFAENKGVVKLLTKFAPPIPVLDAIPPDMAFSRAGVPTMTDELVEFFVVPDVAST